MDWEKIAVEAVLAMSSCCGCNVEGWKVQDYLKEHLTDDERKALSEAVRAKDAEGS